jgi:hypothetical protein
MTVVDKVSGFLDSRLSRRSFVVRSAFAGSAVTVAGTGYVMRPGSAYAATCFCGDNGCGCGSTCCNGYTEFCCVINGGFNFCPDNTVMGGWWKADGSTYCDGPRYYMDCSATCNCTDGCGEGFGFCDTGCDGVNCGCAEGSCDNYLTGCFQFRYGQCNQDLACVGRIVCRVVTCVPPWEIDPSCTTASATDDGTAEQSAPCLTPAPTPPPPPCPSTATQCMVVGLASSKDGAGYSLVTSFGAVLAYGDAANVGDESTTTLSRPIVGMANSPAGGYWLVASDGGIFSFGGASFHGSTGNLVLNQPIVGMAATPSGQGYWLVASDGGIFSFGDAGFYGSTGGLTLNKPIVGMASTADGLGYWLVASDGGIFSFGNAFFYGSTGALTLTQPIVGMATPSGYGYWLVAADGGIFTFGDATFDGSAGGTTLPKPVVGMAAVPGGGGYWIATEDGSIYNYGNAGFFGSAG